MMTKERPFCFDEHGNPVQHGEPYLKALWTGIAKCGLEHRQEESKFDVAKFYKPIQVALSHVDSLLTVVQECRKKDGKVAVIKGDSDTHPLVIAHDRRAMYIESAANLRQQADLLSKTFTRFESFLHSYVKPLMKAGFQVDYTGTIWVVDFGYKQMFSHFNAHYDSVVSRGNYAVMDLDKTADKLVYKLPQRPIQKLYISKNGQLEGLLNLFPVDQQLSENQDLIEFATTLCTHRQSVLEKDLYEHILGSNIFDEDELRFSEFDESTEFSSSPVLLDLLLKYLTRQ